MTLSGAAVVFLTSLTALPVSYIWDTVAHFKDQKLIFITAVLSFGLVTAVPWFVLHKKVQRVEHFCVLCLLLFRSVLSLAIAMENDGLIAEFMGYYLREGEPYLKTAHGTMISYWDGIAHYGMYLMMLAAVSWNQSFCDVGLYWAGSFACSELVLILAVLIGKDGVRLPFFINFPFLAVCVIVFIKSFSGKCDEISQMQKEMKEDTKKDRIIDSSILKRPVDLAFVIYYVSASCLTLFRFVAAMGGNIAVVNVYCEKIEPYLLDPLPYARTQLMVQTFYFIPYHILSIYSLLKPGQVWVTKWSLVHAGAAAQSQFSFIGSSFHYRTPYIHRLPQTALARIVFWIVNGLMFAAPQIAAFRCISSPHYYLLEPHQDSPEQTASVIINGANVVGNNCTKKVD